MRDCSSFQVKYCSLCLQLDNRGTARRGLKFESYLKQKLGQIDADDQLTGAEWLVKQGLTKAGHIGLYGWSYGGYLSAMTLSRYPDFFKCAIAGAPVKLTQENHKNDGMQNLIQCS